MTSADVLFVAVSTYTAQTVNAPTDSQGNTYALAATAANPGNSVASIYVATAALTGSDTITCHLGGPSNVHCHIYEVTGVTTTLDASGVALSTGSALSVSTTAATSYPNDYILSYFAADNSRVTYTPGPYSSDGETTISPSNDTAFSEDSVTTTPGVITATTTASGADAFVNLIVAFKGEPPAGPSLILAPTSLSFVATAGTAPASNTLNLSMSSGTSTFSAASDAAWLTLSPASGSLGTAPTPLTVSATAMATCPQYLVGHITVTAPGVNNSPAAESITYTASCIPHTVQLSWSASPAPPSLDGYNVYRYAAGASCSGTVTQLNSSLITSTTFADSTVVSGATYCYYSTATSAGVESAPSNTFSLTVPMP
ncbi:MAG: BACON domain-containing protein [Candidatus Acidiferrales bacterium]